MAIFQVSSIFAIFLPLEIEPVIHFTAETFLHTFSFLRPPEPDQNMPYMSPYHRPVMNSTTLHRNGQILRLSSKFHVPQKTVVPNMNICIIIKATHPIMSQVYVVLIVHVLSQRHC